MAMWERSITNWRFQVCLNNTLNNNTIRCKRLGTIVSDRKYAEPPFVRRHSCLLVFAWRWVVLRIFDLKQFLRVSSILRWYYAKCYSIIYIYIYICCCTNSSFFTFIFLLSTLRMLFCRKFCWILYQSVSIHLKEN